MNIIKINVYPALGWSSYVVHIEVPNWVNDIDSFIDDWVHDNLINVDHWRYVE